MPFEKLKSKSKPSWSSSNNNNGRLFVLPHDLLEEIATTYFSRREAAALLTVNSQFHTAFSRTVWHTLDASNSSMKSTVGAIWQKYSHLVRYVRINLNQLSAQWCARLPNVVELTLQLSHLGSVKTDGIKLLKLRRIRFVTHEVKWAASGARKCMELVHQLEKVNKSLLVDWELVLTLKEHYVVLGAIINKINDTDRHSFSITNLASRSLGLSQFSKVVQMLISLDISDSSRYLKDFFENSNSSSSSSSSSSNTGHTFPRLTTLRLSSYFGIGKDELLESILTPVHFPSLAKMQFELADNIDHMPGFSDSTRHCWSSIMELRFLNSSNSCVVNQVLELVPNLQRLILEECYLNLKIARLANYLHRLRYFEFGTMVWLISDYQYGLQGDDNVHTPMASLKDIVFRFEDKYDDYCYFYNGSDYGSDFDSDYGSNYYGNYDYAASIQFLLKFIFRGGAPNLLSLEFRGSGLVDWMVYTLKHGQQVNKAVRTLILPDKIIGFGVGSTPEMTAMFPNLKFLTLRECAAATRMKLQEQYPHLIITVEPVTTCHFPSSIS
ncbi:hypothetical protein GQ42DRAFT_5618 [Ramicandelaber brevisporus]|nr:hypothetical protein GQ42DRAFT_5618 [Ramicandelaber brevisporus]